MFTFNKDVPGYVGIVQDGCYPFFGPGVNKESFQFQDGFFFQSARMKERGLAEYRIVFEKAPEGTYASLSEWGHEKLKPINLAHLTLDNARSVGFSWGRMFTVDIRRGDPFKSDGVSVVSSFRVETMYNCCGLMLINSPSDVNPEINWEWIRLLAISVGFPQVYYTGPTTYKRNPPGIEPIMTYRNRDGTRDLGHYAFTPKKVGPFWKPGAPEKTT